MRFPIAISAAALIGVAIAACSGGQSSNYIAPPPAASATTGPVTLAQTSSSQTLGGSNNVTDAVLTFGSGSGTVNGTSSATAPAGTSAVVPADRIRIQASTPSPTSPTVYYVTITTSSGATLSGLPQVSLALSTAAIGTYQEAQYTGGVWANVAGSSSTLNSAGTSVVFAMGGTPITLAANGSIYLAFYQGNYPNATPTPLAPPTNVIADSGFESGSAAPYGSTVNATGWTQCTISGLAPGATAPTRALSTFTPTPGSTPGASIVASGATVQVGTASPHATVTAVPVAGGSYTAEFGGVFSSYNQEDLRYNGLCQIVNVPLNPALTFNILGNGNDGSTYDDFEIDVLNASNQYVANLYEDPNPSNSTQGDTSYRSILVPATTVAPYAGKTVTLFVGLWVDAGSASGSKSYGENYFLDNFSLVGNP